MKDQNNFNCIIEEMDNSKKFGKFLANPLPGDEVVISGYSGSYPESDNVEELMENLFNKKDMVSGEPRRWEHVYPEIPKRLGMLKTIDKFDGGFFGIHPRQVESLSPLGKLLLEKVIEAILDAGVNPADLAGTRTGVFGGLCYCEAEFKWYFDRFLPQYWGILGNEKSVYIDRIAYFLKLKGVSTTADTACNSSMAAFDQAYRSIRTGESDMAIVVGANLCIHPNISLQFARLGVLAKDDYCRVFDEDGTGYIRSEAAVAMFLQKAKDSNRIYARIVHAKSNSDGYKEQGITYPNGSVQKILLEEVYSECDVNPTELSYLEAHGTGTKAGDPEEMNCADEFFAKTRTGPLLVGSVKSNIGHSESTSGLCSISKVLITLETGVIPPNINIKTPRKNIPAFYENRMKIVTDNTPLQDEKGLIGVSSFGFGGSNTHVLLKWNPKSKKNQGKPLDDLPRLVCVSGRTESAVKVLLDDVVKKFDVEHIRLVQNIFRKNIGNYLYRGFTISSKNGELQRSTTFSPNNERQLFIYFGGFTTDNVKMALEWFKLPILTNFQNRLTTYLSELKINFKKLLENPKKNDFTETFVMFISQATIVEILKELEIKPKVVYGKSYGEFASAYFKKNITFEEYVNYAYVVANLVENTDQYNKSITETPPSKFEKELNKELKHLIAVKFENFKKNNINIQNGYAISTKNHHDHQLDFDNGQNGPINIPRNSIIWECGQSLLPTQKKYCRTVSVDHGKGLNGILESIGRLYELGLNPQTHKLYPNVEFPVSRGTPMISPKIRWEHTRTHEVVQVYNNFEVSSAKEVNQFKISSDMQEWDYLAGHCIDGRDLFPAAGYLYLAWLTLGQIKDTDINHLKVVFENCKFKRACTTPKLGSQGSLDLMILYQRVTGKFEITEGDVPVVTGTIRLLKDEDQLTLPSPLKTDNDILLNRRDIYKELRLRGYHYKGLFRGLTQSNKHGSQGKIEWYDNWIAFIDHMLQIKILGEDTRLLFVPTSIAKMTIDPIRQREIVEKLKVEETRNFELPVDVNLDAGIIRCAGVTIQGINASSIARRKYAGLPVLEKYQFVPNKSVLSLEPALRVILQIALENNCGLPVKSVELLDDATKDDSELLSPIMQEILEDQPLVQSDITVLSSRNLDLGLNVENKKLVTQTECTIVVGSSLFDRPVVLKEALGATADFGYLISREPLNWNPDSVNISNIAITNVYKTTEEQLVFAKKIVEHKKKGTILIKVSENDNEFSWLPKVQEARKSNLEVILYSQNEPLNGIIGLVNCIRREPECENIKALFIVDEKVHFDPKMDFFKKQLNKEMAINVLKNGEWGTYRHLLLSELNKTESEHSYANTTVRGDLSSLKWIEGPLSSKSAIVSKDTLVEVHYSSLNFRDVMTASGKINADIITRDRREQECVQGFEFSGKTLSGRRVMGMVSQGALATLVKADNSLLWDVPKNWTLKQAATVPVVYGTCLYALVVIGQIKKGESVLIHSGTGGIGQAAINLCLHMGCTVFTTVGTPEKREFIKKHFPQINEKHIGNSRDLSFQLQILKETNGRGVDIVLNSLAEEKLFASLHCLAKNGRFLEIGKFDLANDNEMSLWALRKTASYHGVMLDKLFNEPPHVKKVLNDLVQSYIELGAVKPLTNNVFEQSELEQAFRFMSSGKHMGKVLIKIRDEKEEKKNLKFCAVPRYCCNPDRSYIICGGLGGFGLELADWLVLRGAKNLILTSRRGVSTGYQNYRISIWRSYGCKISVCTEDITTKSGCKALVETANFLAPVEGIFNLAVILQDAILENQTPEMFKTSFGPKAYATQILDEVTRTLCPQLKEFVVFSSVSCGRGNAGQSNYGMSNSVMERICEKRRNEGLPALAIEWGAIGEVGLVAELQEEHIELAIGGTLQQSIANCLQCMDILMRQKESAIVSSIVVAEKKLASSSDNIFEAVADILGINDLKAVSSQSTLAELGMDSMNAVEIKQTLERDFGIFLTPSEVRNLTFSSLQDLQKSSPDQHTYTLGEDNTDIYNVLKYISNVDTLHKPVLKLRSKSENGPTVLALPGLEGVANQFQNLAHLIDAKVYCLQYYGSEQKDTIEDMAESLYPHAQAVFQNSKKFHIVAHSTGAVVAIELIKLLENKGHTGTLTCIDGSPDFIKTLVGSISKANRDNEILSDLENAIVQGCLRLQFKEYEVVEIMENIAPCPTLEDKLEHLQTAMKSDNIIKEVVKSTVLRSKASFLYKPNVTRLKTKIRLCKPSVASLKFELEDYGLGRFTKNPVEVKTYEGTHSTLLESQRLADDLMESIRNN